jgi:hypothetical protein
MNSLYDEMCAYRQDGFIKTTCVFPLFINTRKELAEILDQSKQTVPRMSPEFAADVIVKGILLDRRDITLPKAAGLLEFTK